MDLCSAKSSFRCTLNETRSFLTYRKIISFLELLGGFTSNPMRMVCLGQLGHRYRLRRTFSEIVQRKAIDKNLGSRWKLSGWWRTIRFDVKNHHVLKVESWECPQMSCSYVGNFIAIFQIGGLRRPPGH